MAEILKQNKIQITHYKFIGDSIPVKVTYFDNAPAKVILSDNNEIESSCVNCQELSCIKRDNSVIVFDELKSSQTDKICPTNAIEVSDSGNVSVDSESCIGCGLCIASCPIGAIYLNENLVAEVNYNHNSITESESALSLNEHNLNYSNSALRESDKIFINLISTINTLTSKTNVINLLVCKSLSLLGLPTYLTRQGDINIRMDGIGLYNERFVLIEAELSANLDSPRDILDDVAVFCSRYNVKKENTIGAIILPELPNKRTEFWELLSDIKNVVDVEIAVLPLSALLALVWNRQKIKLEYYYLNKDLTSARAALNKQLGRAANISEPSNLLEAAK